MSKNLDLGTKSKGGIVPIFDVLRSHFSDHTLFLDQFTSIGLHQPPSFLLAPILLLITPKSTIYLYLHEASYYNVNLKRPLSYVLAAYRFSVVKILSSFSRISILPVSKFVSRSYLLRFHSYPSYYFNLIESLRSSFKQISDNDFVSFSCRRSIVVYTRSIPPTKSAISLLYSLLLTYPDHDVYTIGHFNSEINSLINNLAGSNVFKGFVDRSELYQLLSFSQFFVNTFPFEAFGVTAFEAALHDNVILYPHPNGLDEWLPAVCSSLSKSFMRRVVPPESALQEASLACHRAAWNLIQIR